MARPKYDDFDELKKRFEELGTAPVGWVIICNDLDVAVFEYCDHIAGLVSSYLTEKRKIELNQIISSDELDRKMSECEERLNNLKIYKKSFDEIGRLLIACLKNKT